MNTRQFKFQFFNMVIRDIMGAIEGGSLMGSATLAMLAIDFLAYHKYLTRKEREDGMLPNIGEAYQESTDYKAMIEDYFPQISSRAGTEDLANFIWATRCSLVHVYGTAKAAYGKNFSLNLRFRFSHTDFRETHLEVCKIEGKPDKTVIKYHLPTWIAEVIILADMYLDRLDAGSLAFQRWSSEFLVIFVGDSSSTISIRDDLGYKSIHPFLSILDVKEKPSPPVMVDILSNLIYTRLNQ